MKKKESRNNFDSTRNKNASELINVPSSKISGVLSQIDYSSKPKLNCNTNFQTIKSGIITEGGYLSPGIMSSINNPVGL